MSPAITVLYAGIAGCSLPESTTVQEEMTHPEGGQDEAALTVSCHASASQCFAKMTGDQPFGEFMQRRAPAHLRCRLTIPP